MGNEKEKDKKEAALLQELALLGNMMKLHEWTRLGPKEAEDEAELEAKLDSKIASLETDQPQSKKEVE